MEDNQNKRKELGIVIPVPTKNNPSSYDLKGSIIIDGKKYRVGGYKAEAKAGSKLGEGSVYYYWHRVEPLDDLEV